MNLVEQGRGFDLGNHAFLRVFLGSDHAAYELKDHLVKVLGEAGHEPIDCGAHVYDAEDDYPPYCFDVGERVVAEPGSLGVVLGGSGNGEQIAANKVTGTRAALVWSDETARLAREHNDANVISIGARNHAEVDPYAIPRQRRGGTSVGPVAWRRRL